jgi:hypothetical protein
MEAALPFTSIMRLCSFRTVGAASLALEQADAVAASAAEFRRKARLVSMGTPLI